MKTISTIPRNLTFDDLREWAGGKILNRGKGYVKRVDQLSRTRENELVAWVTGSERYATSVRVAAKGDPESFCTCPYEWGPCKHAVAIILAAAERLKRKVPIPTLDEDDDLSLALPGDADEEDDGRKNDEPEPVRAPRRSKARTGID